MIRATRGGVAGAVLVALGAVSLVEAFRIRDEWLGARLLPTAIGAVLVILGALHPIAAAAAPPAWPDPASGRRVAFAFGVLMVYVTVLPSLGFLPSTGLFVAILLRRLGSYSWAVTLGLTGAITIASHMLFKRWLGLPLPAGPLGL